MRRAGAQRWSRRRLLARAQRHGPAAGLGWRRSVAPFVRGFRDPLLYTRDERHVPSPRDSGERAAQITPPLSPLSRGEGAHRVRRGRRSSRGDGGNGTDLVAVALVEGEVLHDANALGERLALEICQRLAQVAGGKAARLPPPF